MTTSSGSVVAGGGPLLLRASSYFLGLYYLESLPLPFLFLSVCFNA